MTFEQLYAPVLTVIDEKEAKKCFENLIIIALKRAAWDDNPNNRERAAEIVREEIEFLAQFETPPKAETLRRLFQTPNPLAATP
jgi:hypothetical protein